jgi:drug/metabolite transporter (DMT)-like permease
MLAVFWGLNWPIMKIGVSEIPPWTFRGGASLVGGLGLLLIAAVGRLPLRIPRRELPGLALAGLLNITGWSILVLHGIARMNSGRAAILAYTMPLWATLLGALVLGERLRPRAIVALFFGLAGMALLFSAGDSLSGDDLWGPVLVVLAAMSWGAGTVAVKYFRFSMPIVVSTAWQHLIGVIPVLIVAAMWEIEHIGHVSAVALMALLYNMIITAIVCYWAYFKVVVYLPVVASTVGTLMVPVIGVFSSALVFAETPALVDYLALVFVVVAVLLVMTAAADRP